jgi:protein-disulfide isomerase
MFSYFKSSLILQLSGRCLSLKQAETGWGLLVFRNGLLALIFLFAIPDVFADSSSSGQLQPIRNEFPGISRQQGDAILQELRSIRKLLQQQQTTTKAKPRKRRPATAKIKLGDHPAMGSKDAPVTMVEFTDYQCPYCKRFHDNTFPKLKQKYIDSGKLRYIAMDLPLRFHAQAKPAAGAALCAKEQNKFWPFREALFNNPRKLGRNDLLGYARNLSMNVKDFEQCIDQNRYIAAIRQSTQIANGAGFTGTPSFVIGKNVKGLVDGVALIGAKPLVEFESQIDRLLPKEK